MGQNKMTACDLATNIMVSLMRRGYIELDNVPNAITDMEVVIQSVIHAPPAKIASAVIKELFENSEVVEVYAEDIEITQVVCKFASKRKAEVH